MSDGAWELLEPRARWLFHLREVGELGLVVYPGLAVATFFASSVLPAPVALGAGALAALAALVWAVWSPSAAWGGWAYLMRDHDLLIASGVLVREVVAIPYDRIQHVDVAQGPLERAFGLARLAIYTGTGSGADGLVPGLDLARAEALRDRLIRGVADDGV
jgi:hypothetical protein